MFNNPFLKKDSLLEAVKEVQQDGAFRRQAEAIVNEEFGVYSRKAVVREHLAAYDARLEEAYKCMKEGKPLADKDYDKDGKIESGKAEYQGSRIRAAKLAGKMEEADMGVGAPGSASGREALKAAGNPPMGTFADIKGGQIAASSIAKSKTSTPPVKEGMMDPKDPSVQGSGDVTSTPAKHVKPSNPERIKNFKDPRDSSVQGSGEVTSGGKPVSVREGWVSLGLPYDKFGDRNPHAKIYTSNGRKSEGPKDPTPGEAEPGAGDTYKGSRQGGRTRYAKKTVKEEQINEISKELAGRYIKKAHYSGGMTDFKHGKIYGQELAKKRKTKDSPWKSELNRASQKREKGIETAVNKLTGRAKVSANEETINEISNKVKQSYIEKAGKEVESNKSAGFKKDYSEKKGKKAASAREGLRKRIKGMTAAFRTMKEDSSFNSAQATGKTVNEVTAAPPPVVQQPAPAVRGPAARLQGTRYYRGMSANVQGRGSAQFGPQQTARVAPPAPKTGTSLVPSSGSRAPATTGASSVPSTGAKTAVPATTGGRNVTATAQGASKASSGFTYSRLGDTPIATKSLAGRVTSMAGRIASKALGPLSVAADVVTPSGKTEPGNPVFRKTDTGKGEVAGYRSATTPRKTDINTQSRMVGDASRRGRLAPSVRNQELPAKIAPVQTKEPGTLSAPAPKAAAPAAKTQPSSFKQAFAQARKEAGGAKGQFEFGGKKFQTNINPAKGAEKYVAPSTQKATSVKVDTAAKPAEQPKTTAAADVPVPPKKPAELAAAAPKAEPATQSPGPEKPIAGAAPTVQADKFEKPAKKLAESVIVGGNKYRIV